MDKKKLEKALKELRESSKKRKFSQGLDLIINLKNLDLKKPENHVELYVFLESKKKENNICAFVGPELVEDAKANGATTIQEKEFETFAKDKKKIKKLSEDHEFFIAQANIMPKVAATFGRVLGPRKKMPNPKAGCIVPPKGNLKPIIDKLRKTIRAIAKERLVIQVCIGDESMTDEDLITNIMNVYNQVAHKVPDEKNNIKNAFIKLSMSKAIQVI